MTNNLIVHLPHNALLLLTQFAEQAEILERTDREDAAFTLHILWEAKIPGTGKKAEELKQLQYRLANLLLEFGPAVKVDTHNTIACCTHELIVEYDSQTFAFTAKPQFLLAFADVFEGDFNGRIRGKKELRAAVEEK